MSLKGKGPVGPAPILKNVATAPVVYFDTVPVYGVSAGNIQIELGARMLSPTREEEVVVDLACTAHVRCSPQAAVALIDALQKSLAMIAKQSEEPSPLLHS